jgi:hypothetical protein
MSAAAKPSGDVAIAATTRTLPLTTIAGLHFPLLRLGPGS